jgi:hypothetical protein
VQSGIPILSDGPLSTSSDRYDKDGTEELQLCCFGSRVQMDEHRVIV